jgi:endo-1,4-beta-D-glucanase Y
MSKIQWPREKLAFLFGIIFFYVVVAAALIFASSTGAIQKSSQKFLQDNSTAQIPTYLIQPNLQAAESFLQGNLVKSNGHIDLYMTTSQNQTLQDNNTNSEAISYYLLWTAQANDKKDFDKALSFVQLHMAQPKFGYLMWKLQANDTVVNDGSNIASDADLRAIKALLIAEKQWNDPTYTAMINQLAAGLERVAVTSDGYLAPYGGASGDTSTWSAKEVYLSYSDFTVFQELAKIRGESWTSIYDKMKAASLKAQLANGLYNSMLTESRQYGNGIDGGAYSINSMWMMVRNAESGDPDLMQSASKSLQFYKDKFTVDAALYASYSSNGDALSPSETPWAYALVGRAAIALNDKPFSQAMIQKLLSLQVLDSTLPIFGAFPEYYGQQVRVGQFTMQESILTMQDYMKMK